MRQLLRLGLMLLLFTLAYAQAETLRVGYFDLPPHVSANTETTTDSEITANTETNSNAALQYFDQIAAEMGVEVSYQAYPLSRLLQMLDEGKLDAALFLARNPEREKRFVYPQIPLITTQSIFVVSQLSRFHKASDITREHSLTIGVWKGGYYSPTLSNSDNKLIRLSGNNVALRGLESVIRGRFDAFYSPDKYAVEYQAKKHKQRGMVRIIPNANETISLYTAFSQKAGARYVKAYEQALSRVKARRSYESVITQFTANEPKPRHF